MRGKWLQRVRDLHTWLGIFFSPLLLLFIVTGWWQTFVSEDAKNKGLFNSTMSKFSTIHTDDHLPRNAGAHHTSEHFKLLVGCMAVALILSILLGLALACRDMKKSAWTLLALILGILVPAGILYFS